MNGLPKRIRDFLKPGDTTNEEDFTQALDLLSEAVSALERLSKRVEELQVIKNRAEMFWNQRQFNSAEVTDLARFILTGITGTKESHP